MKMVKNSLVFLIGLIQIFIGAGWFIAWFVEHVVTEIHPSVHFLFGSILILGLINLFSSLTIFMHSILKRKLKVGSGFSVALLSVILTVILLLMLRFALSLSK